MLNPLNHPICFAYPLRAAPSAWMEHVPFGMLLVDLLRPKVIVELGTYYGASYCGFCQAVRELNLDAKCYAVDNWQGDPHQGQYGADVLDDLKKHHDPLYSGFSRLIRSDFDKACTHFADGTIDLLHIDGYHVYDAVKADFETWRPKLSRRGVVLFHDINVREYEFGVWKLWDELKAQYASFEFTHEHGLGVLAVGPESADAMKSLLELNGEEARRLREFLFQLGQRHKIRYEAEAAQEALRTQHAQALKPLIEQMTEKDAAAAALQIRLAAAETELQSQTAALQMELQSRTAAFEAESQSLSACIRHHEQLQMRLQHAEQSVAQLSANLTAEQRATESLQDTLSYSAKDQRAAEHRLRGKEQMLRMVQEQTSQQKAQLQSKDVQLNEQSQTLAMLQSQLHLMMSSRSWRLAHKLRGVRRRLSVLKRKALRGPVLTRRVLAVTYREGIRGVATRSTRKISPWLLAGKKLVQSVLPKRSAPIIPHQHATSFALPMLTTPVMSPSQSLEAMIGDDPACLLVTHVGGGGTERHVQDMAARLEQEGVRAIILRPIDATRVRLERPRMQSSLAIPYADGDELRNTLEVLEIKHIHVHHLMNYNSGLRTLIDDLGVPYDFTVHDYYSICPRVHLSGPDGRYCGEPDAAGCTSCVRKHGGPYGLDVRNVNVEDWRRENAEWLHGARNVYVPNDDVRERLSRYFPDVHFAVRPHFAAFANARPVAARRISYEPLRVAILGTLAPHKGLQIVRDCARDAAARKLAIRFHIIGSTENDAAFAGLANVHITGAYDENTVFDLIESQKCHCSLFPATWPETFSYTLSIAMAAGLVPLAFDLGAIGERITETGWGELMPWTSDAATVNDRLLTLGDSLMLPRPLPTAPNGEYGNLWRDYYELTANEDAPRMLPFRRAA